MAKKSAIAKNKQRADRAKRHGPKRAVLRAKVRDESLSPEERFQAVLPPVSKAPFFTASTAVSIFP